MRSWVLATAAASALTAAAPRDAWYVLQAEDGTTIGYASETQRLGPDGYESVAFQEVSLLAEGGGPTRFTQETVTRFDAAGRVRTLTSVSTLGRDTTRTEAVIRPGLALVTRTSVSGVVRSEIELPPGVRMDSGAGLLRGRAAGALERLEFLNFNLDAQAVERVVIEPAGQGAVLRTRYDGEELRGVARLQLSPDGRILASTQPMLGARITVRVSDRETAMKPHTPYPGLRRALFRAPYRMSAAAVEIGRAHV